MKVEEVKDEEMYCLFTPDGFWQPSTLAPDFAFCLAFIKMLHKKGIGKSFHQLTLEGCKIMPVKVSIVQNGDENKPFRK